MPIYTFALFDDKTAELVNIRPLFVSTDKPIQIYMQSFNSPKVKESAKTGIECAYEALFSCENLKHKQTEYISVIPKDFNRKVDGSSAGLAYAVAFITQLINWSKIECPVDLPRKIAATGVIDNLGNISGVNFIRQKILAAVENNVELVLFPSDNYEEVENLLNTDSLFCTTVNNSQIKLKHVSNINQVLCELGIFTKPYIDISCSGISSSNETSYRVILHNQANLGFYSFQLEFNYDITCLELAEVYTNNSLIKSTVHDAGKILLTFDSNNDISCIIKDSITIAEISFKVLKMPIDVQSNFYINDKASNINNYSCRLMGGIDFYTNERNRINTINNSTVSNNTHEIVEADTNEFSSYKNQIKKGKLKYILVLALFLSVCSLFTLTFYSMKKKKTPPTVNANEPVISQAPTAKAGQTPLNTMAASVDVSITPTVAPSFTIDAPSPDYTSNDLPVQIHTPFETKIPSTPTHGISTPTPAASAGPTSTHTPIPTNTPMPSPVPSPVRIKELLDSTNWSVAGKSNAAISLESSQIDSHNVFSINYSITGNGNASIKSKNKAIGFPEGYSKLTFAYKCLSQNSLRDSITIIINYTDKAERINLGSSEELSLIKNWTTKEIPLDSNKKVDSIEIFIGNLFNQDTEANKGVFMLRDFYMY